MSAGTSNLEQSSSISSDYDDFRLDFHNFEKSSSHLNPERLNSSSPSSHSLTRKLFRKLQQVRTLAFGTLRHPRKNKTMDNEDEEARVSPAFRLRVSDNSSVEEDEKAQVYPAFSNAISDDSSVEEMDISGEMRIGEEEDYVSLLVEPFVPLTDEEEADVNRAFSDSNRHEILISHANIEITGEVLQCLKPCGWLNDEVIDLYLELLKEREQREPERFLSCHFFNALFYRKLTNGEVGYDFQAVRRWTTRRNLGYDLNDCDKIFVPIHKERHWCLAIINRRDEKFQYLDSLKGIDSNVLEVLARYYVEEVKDKSGIDVDIRSWDLEYVEDLPAQKNGWDCGMFMIKYVDFYSSRKLGLCFDQEDMPYFRRRTAKEILRLKVT